MSDSNWWNSYINPADPFELDRPFNVGMGCLNPPTGAAYIEILARHNRKFAVILLHDSSEAEAAMLKAKHLVELLNAVPAQSPVDPA